MFLPSSLPTQGHPRPLSPGAPPPRGALEAVGRDGLPQLPNSQARQRPPLSRRGGATELTGGGEGKLKCRRAVMITA